MTERKTFPIDTIANPETGRNLSTQAVVIRTIGTPELLKRNLAAIKRGIGETCATSSITVGVIDDSKDPLTIQANKHALAEAGVGGHYLSTKETDDNSLLTRVCERAVALAVSHGLPASDVITAYKYLLTEQTDINRPNFLPDMQVGSGSNATSNVATLLGAYMLGFSGTPDTQGVITHYDNDVIPGTTLAMDNGVPKVVVFDAFKERDDLFADQERLLSAGKYTGIAGDPFGTAVIALQVTEGIISDFQKGDHAALSPYPIFDASTNSFSQVSVGEAFTQLPTIINAFLVRAPITGFLTQEDLAHFTPATIKHDGGNVTIRDSFARLVPASPTGVHEYSILAPLKALYPDDDPNRLVGIETPALHIRADLPPEIDLHAGGLLSGTSGRIVRHQVLIENAFAKNPSLGDDLYQTWSDRPTPSNVLDALPRLNTGANTNKKERLINVKRLRDRIHDLVSVVSDNEAVRVSVQSLLVEFDDSAIAAIEEALDMTALSDEDVRKMSIGIQRYYLPAVKYWPTLYDAAYAVGQEDAS